VCLFSIGQWRIEISIAWDHEADELDLPFSSDIPHMTESDVDLQVLLLEGK
jgi:hypothetical protein